MFRNGEIWAYPTDTSFGLGVRADDAAGLLRLAELKGDRTGKYFSLMCADEAMLREFAVVPDGFDVTRFFFEKPRTIILQPTERLPRSPFWPERVGFRISTIGSVAAAIGFPVTATSANRAGERTLFNVEELEAIFGDAVSIYRETTVLQEREPSEIWDYTAAAPVRIR